MTVPDVVLCPPGQPHTDLTVRVPYDPRATWLIVAVPLGEDLLDDPRMTPRQVAVDAACEARDTTEQVVYAAVHARRMGAA